LLSPPLALLIKGLPIRITTDARAATITFAALVFIIFFFYVLRCCYEKSLAAGNGVGVDDGEQKGMAEQ
jgi:hypothetical protein